MKIGILTFHRATNYGAILQAYALSSYLNSVGHETQVIDYKPAGLGLLYLPINVPTLAGKIKRLIINVFMLPSLKKRKKKRTMFRSYVENTLPLTSIVLDEASLPHMDVYIVGSDQVWSTCFTGGIDKFYWGQFDRKGAKLISYAGSAAENMGESFTSNDNARLLETFDSISVREDELKHFLNDAIPSKNIAKVLDPTLMAGVSFFEELIKGEKPLSRNYILIYQVVRSKNNLIQEYAKERAKEKGCDIVEIKDSRLTITTNGERTVLKELINPSQYVSLFKYAELIVTTSFHGTAFSLLFNRPFNVISVSLEVDSRSKDILEQIGLGANMIELPTTGSIPQINWVNINNKLEVLRTHSREFLNSAINK